MKFSPSSPTSAARRYTIRTVEFQTSPILRPMDKTRSLTDRMGLGLSRKQQGVL
ncbi:hypothetical protein [Spirulina major]|uniref:hypothetical protein n=1 Tax=Spirulina major TaxID=270636 RepID=UPI0015874022|nr:hypothetical protein [Spirulina major]